MRHNPAAGAVVIMLRSLKMHGMAQAVGELTEQGSPAFEAALPILSQLLKAETADREVRSTACQLKAARFPKLPRPCWLRLRQAARSTRRWCLPISVAASSWRNAPQRRRHAIPEPARRILPRRLAFKPSSTTASASASSPRSNSSTPSNRRSWTVLKTSPNRLFSEFIRSRERGLNRWRDFRDCLTSMSG